MRHAGPALMVQGTGSHVGKSLLVAGLCRALARRGLKVAPFKPQNMSNNAAPAKDGGEIGRAQALQAQAAGRPPSVHMNPVLLKPESETGAQVVVQGRRIGAMKAAEYLRRKADLMPAVLESLSTLRRDSDIVMVEGAGSPAETNLRDNDIANMGFAAAAGVPVVIVGDIDRGGVIASLVGTHAVLETNDRSHIAGFIVNRFRGDAGLFAEGVRTIETRTGWPCLGVVPWFDEAHLLPAEDVMGLSASTATHGVMVAVPRLRRIANFDDLDPLNAEPGVTVKIVEAGEAIPPADLVLLPGSKSVIADLAFLRDQGWDIDLRAHVRRGGRVLGLCGGYQMLGRLISDPDGVEGPPAQVSGLGLLQVETVLTEQKTTRAVTGRHVGSGLSLSGYEIHLGRTDGPDCSRPFASIDGEGADGALSDTGRIAGTYLHGIFAEDGFRSAYLASLGGAVSGLSFRATVDATLDRLAEHLEAHLDIDRMLAIADTAMAGASAQNS